MMELPASAATASFPIMFFNREGEVDIGTIAVHPALSFKQFYAIISQMIGIAPHQISFSLVRRKKARASSEVRHKVPIDESSDFAASALPSPPHHRSLELPEPITVFSFAIASPQTPPIHPRLYAYPTSPDLLSSSSLAMAIETETFTFQAKINQLLSLIINTFHTNNKILEEVVIIPSKRLRTKIVGFSTHLMHRIQHGPMHDISPKLQEEECERRMDFIPDASAIKVNHIEVDKESMEMLASLGMADLPGVEK